MFLFCEAKAKTASGMPEISRLRIRVRAYEHRVLDASVKQIIDTALRYDAKIVGPIPLPTEIKKYTVNRASFIYKNTREGEQFGTIAKNICLVNRFIKVNIRSQLFRAGSFASSCQN